MWYSLTATLDLSVGNMAVCFKLLVCLLCADLVGVCPASARLLFVMCMESCVHFYGSVHVGPCRSMSAHVGPCRSMSAHIGPCRSMSVRVGPCRSMSVHIGPCRSMSVHVGPCRSADSSVNN